MPRKPKENEELNNKKTKTTASTSKKTQSKKQASSTSKNKKTSEKVAKSTTSKKKTQPKKIITEYYDLPQKYNQTIVKILAQTPKTLFIYWEISDDDLQKYKKLYGENFFETTKPILIIHNTTLNYSFEVEINDFANSWYLHIDDSKSNYSVELGRRPFIKNNNITSDYICISSSNAIELPNDHILFNNSQKMISFRNVKTNQTIEKPISTLSSMNGISKIYNIYDLYKELYKNEDNISNPSSGTLLQFK